MRRVSGFLTAEMLLYSLLLALGLASFMKFFEGQLAAQRGELLKADFQGLVQRVGMSLGRSDLCTRALRSARIDSSTGLPMGALFDPSAPPERQIAAIDLVNSVWLGSESITAFGRNDKGLKIVDLTLTEVPGANRVVTGNETTFIADLTVKAEKTVRAIGRPTFSHRFPLSVTVDSSGDPATSGRIKRCILASSDNGNSESLRLLGPVYLDSNQTFAEFQANPSGICGSLDSTSGNHNPRLWRGAIECPAGYQAISGGLVQSYGGPANPIIAQFAPQGGNLQNNFQESTNPRMWVVMPCMYTVFTDPVSGLPVQGTRVDDAIFATCARVAE